MSDKVTVQNKSKMPTYWKSTNDDTPIYINFKNGKKSPISLFWISYNGELTFYAEVYPGYDFTLQTFVSHPWVIKKNDHIIASLRPNETINANETVHIVTTKKTFYSHQPYELDESLSDGYAYSDGPDDDIPAPYYTGIPAPKTGIPAPKTGIPAPKKHHDLPSDDEDIGYCKD